MPSYPEPEIHFPQLAELERRDKFAGAYAQEDQDPPTRVADLSYLAGNISMQPAGADDWSPAVVNRPFTTGDNLWVDVDARAEFWMRQHRPRPLGDQRGYHIPSEPGRAETRPVFKSTT